MRSRFERQTMFRFVHLPIHAMHSTDSATPFLLLLILAPACLTRVDALFRHAFHFSRKRYYTHTTVSILLHAHNHIHHTNRSCAPPGMVFKLRRTLCSEQTFSF